ncbi:ADP-ribosylglycohydrolase family protein [Methanobrevibacter sp.]|uniref:ADP-ribosylglycohydrolase family protein n=1 Tax=Methanobrevibacter sp. TaxID=66852 RepID=UPI00388FBF71
MKGIIGAICGDIIGSVYEFNSIKTKEFELFGDRSTFTDDTVMTLAIANWLTNDKTSEDVLIKELQLFGNRYIGAGYGRMFLNWLREENPQPYGSWANGSAMRVSPCAWVANSLEEAQDLAYKSAVVTHNHPEAIKGALATVDAIYLARIGANKDEIKDHVETRYEYNLNRSLNEIRPFYSFDVSCAGSVPESIICFLEADDFEDTIRNCVSLGGDADTQAAIAGGIASAYWEVPEDIVDNSVNRLDDFLLDALMKFEDKFI